MICGGVLSWTVIVWLQVFKKPLVSVTVRVKTIFVLQPMPEVTLTVWASEEVRMAPAPLADQE